MEKFQPGVAISARVRAIASARVRAIPSTAGFRADTGDEGIADRAADHILDRIGAALGVTARFAHLVHAILVLNLLTALQVFESLPDGEDNQAENDQLGK